MKTTFEAIKQYCSEWSNGTGDLLQALERESHLKTMAPQMLAGPWMGLFLQFISQMVRPYKVLEIGGFTGYSALCLAAGLRKDGIMHTIEVNPEHAQFIRKYIDQAGLEMRVQLHIGDAKNIIPGLEGPFDLCLIDAGKRDNSRFFDLVLPKMSKGGMILIDNTLWDGKVLRHSTDLDSKAIHQFNQRMHADPRVEQVILPIRDGLSLLRVV